MNVNYRHWHWHRHRHRHWLWLWLLLWVLGLMGCNALTDFDPTIIKTTERKQYTFPQTSETQGVDVLVVLDTRDATLMAEVRPMVQQWIEGFAATQHIVEYDPHTGDSTSMGQDYPIHVGFVSADVGVLGAYYFLSTYWQWEAPPIPPGCNFFGASGRLLHPAMPPPGWPRFLHPFMMLQYGWVLNYFHDGGQEAQEAWISVADAFDQFWTAATWAPSTCPFVQPLAAVMAALDSTYAPNTGFNRRNAALVILIVSPADDCSSLFWDFFEDESTGQAIDDPFQCFLKGVVCDDAVLQSQPGLKTGCRPRSWYLDSDAPLLEIPGVDSYAGIVPIIRKAKPLVPIIPAVISGKSDAVRVVEATAGRVSLAPSGECEDATPQAYPAVRLRAFTDAFPEGRFHSLCEAGTPDFLSSLIDVYGNEVVKRCIPETLVDTDPQTPELDADCEVDVIRQPGTPDEEVAWDDIPHCDMIDPQDVERPLCWRIGTDARCAPGSSLTIESIFGEEVAYLRFGEEVRATCLVKRQ